MPGRLRTQLVAVEALLPKVEALLDEVRDAAPKGALSVENILSHEDGTLDDPKVTGWNEVQSCLTQCQIELMDLSELLADRIKRSDRRKKLRCGAQGDINDA